MKNNPTNHSLTNRGPREHSLTNLRPKEGQADELQADKAIERERANGNKIRSVYISEASNGNQGLIDGRRSEMDDLLVFSLLSLDRPVTRTTRFRTHDQAGLFFRVITTFVLDSYKTLNPDSLGSQTVVWLSHTVVLLSQISHQLAKTHNGQQ
ncbi:unnamed protein product [Mycena citricolor]|uniref:DUF6535 domain-containing protein n=1 Tax=Mycena citricolor TaxID=2018698 RepID=A0AAD2HP79_9AGAR|nr:unnamed protein product [Mycena citricolor]